MKQSIAEIIASITDKKSTGMLTFSFSSEKNLLKIYFKHGFIYHISFGSYKGMQTLEHIVNKEPQSYNFIPDISIDISSIDLSSHDKVIEFFKNLNKFVSSATAFSSSKREYSNFEAIKERLKIALIRQVGPIGKKIVDTYVQEKWISADPPTREDVLKLIEMLKGEIEDPSSQSEFISEAYKALEGYV